MTPERKRALLIIIATFLAGLLIGALTIGLINHNTRPSATPRVWTDQEKEAYVEGALKQLELRSDKTEEVRSIMRGTIRQIDSMRHSLDGRIRHRVDSMDNVLSGILTAEQMQLLKDYRKSRMKR
jgi:hypothetical protein